MTVIENDERARRLMNITLNPEKIVNQMSSGDYFDVSQSEIKLCGHTFSVRWVINM
jgi:hypothetical protein